MMKLSRLVPFVGCLGLALPAMAQGDLPAPTIRPFSKPTLPKLRPGALPGPDIKPVRGFKPGALAKKDKGKKPKKGKDPRPMPGLKRVGGEDKPGDVQRWRKGEEKKDAKPAAPTLNADFEKNCARLRPGVKVTLDIYDEELEAVVKMIACMTGKNIIMAKPLKGKKITIYSPTQVTANEAYRAFLTALEANGFTISRQGKFLRIIDIKSAARYPDPLLKPGSTPPREDRMVTQIITLKNVDAQEIQQVISKLASQHAQFITYAPTNSLIVTEVASNLRKLRSLIAEMDVPGGADQLWIYQVEHAEASDIAQKTAMCWSLITLFCLCVDVSGKRSFELLTKVEQQASSEIS